MNLPAARPDPTALPWLDAVATALEPFRGQGVIVAVSGGGDSVALLRALMAIRERLALRLAVATLDHTTRGGESAGDSAFVADLAARLGLPCDLGAWSAERSGGFEANARRARYAWLATVAQARGASAVAVGHTRDDQAETILHRIVRGTGLRGLGGMAPRRSLGLGLTLVRPLLGVSRDELRAYLAGLGQAWREDATNADLARTRSRIRHSLLPQLARDQNPGVAEALVRLGEQAADATRRLDQRANRLLARLTIERGPDGLTLDRAGLRRLDPGDRLDLLRAAWRGLGWPEGTMSHARWRRLDALATGSDRGRTAVVAEVEAVATPERWTLRRVQACASLPPSVGTEQPLLVPGATPYRNGQLWATWETVGQAGGSPTSARLGAVERLDADQIAGPCVIRPPQAGDRFDPLGLGGRTQAVADLLRGRRVARADRAAVPVVADARGIVWVVGHRIAHRVRQTESTRRVLALTWEPPTEAS